MTTTVDTRATTGTYVNNAAGQAALNKQTAAKTWAYVSSSAGTVRAFMYTPLPSELAEQDVVSATLVLEMAPGTGTRTVTVQRHAKPSQPYTKMIYSNQPGVLAGSVAHSVTQNSADTTWEFDVSADLAAIAAGGLFYGWRITTTYTGTWKVNGWGSVARPYLSTELDSIPDAPVDVRPDGVTALAAPVFTWRRPNGLISAQLQTDEIGGDFSTPTFTSAVSSTTLAQLDSAALGWSGLTVGASSLVRVKQTTTGGVSEWSDPVTLTRKSQPAVTLTAVSSEDPTPLLTWTTTDQQRFQVTVSSGGTTLHDSGVIAGADSSYQAPKGATKGGQSVTRRVRVWDSEDRSPSPGDPGYAEDTEVTVYTPGTATVDSLVVVQDGVKPWTLLDWTDAGSSAATYQIVRDDEILETIDALDEDDELVTSYTDWTCPPNTDVVYNVVPRDELGAAGAAGPSVPIRTVVTGAWVVDPDTGLYFSTSGDALSLAYAESSVTYLPVGGSRPIKRTFALRGLEGSVSGVLTDYDGRTVAELEADLFAIKALPTQTFRFVEGDVNIPAVISELNTVVNPELSFAKAFPQPRSIRKTVSFNVAQVGELPFPVVSL